MHPQGAIVKNVISGKLSSNLKLKYEYILVNLSQKNCLTNNSCILYGSKIVQSLNERYLLPLYYGGLLIMIENEYSDGRLLFPNPLSCLGNFLERFTENSLFSAVTKDISTSSKEDGRCLLANSIASQKWGLTPQEMEKKTSKELFERVPNFFNYEQILNLVLKTEREALQNGQSNLSCTVLRYDGVVSVQNTIYVPVFNTRHKAAAMFLVTYDLTRYAHLPDLFKLYRKFFPKKSEAAQRLSKYLRLDTYFHPALSYSELSVLLAMTLDPRHKQVASSLKVSPKTVNSQLSSLKSKLKANFELPTLLTNLRFRQQWTLETNHS